RQLFKSKPKIKFELNFQISLGVLTTELQESKSYSTDGIKKLVGMASEETNFVGAPVYYYSQAVSFFCHFKEEGTHDVVQRRMVVVVVVAVVMGGGNGACGSGAIALYTIATQHWSCSADAFTILSCYFFVFHKKFLKKKREKGKKRSRHHRFLTDSIKLV
uniref:Uncharacterized protein n=1 Tax=Wuchereria bancrofti TaxID=6293 RepID=A0A1I8EHE4_WUCBA